MASITVQERTTILKLVAGMFNAAPGATLLNGFTDAFVAMNKDYAALATALSESDAFKSLYPSFLTAEEFANKFLDTLGLKADTNAQDWVKAKVNAGESFGSVIFQALVAIEASTDEQFKAARDQLANKAAVAEYYSVTLGKSADSLEALQAVAANVTNNPASVQAAKDAVTPVEPQPEPEPAPLPLTADQEVRKGTAGNDLFKANVVQNALGAQVNSLGSGDEISGGAGLDTLNAKITSGAFAGGSYSMPIQPETSSVEQINLQAVIADINTVYGINNDQVYVNAKDMTDVVRLASNYSDADLTIMNQTTKGLNKLSDMTVAMEYTGNKDTKWGASDFKVYFDQDYLTPEATLSNPSVDFLAMNEDNYDASNGTRPLEGVFFRQLQFTLNGETFNLAEFMGEDPAGAGDEIVTYDDFLAAVQNALVELQAANADNAALQTMTADFGRPFFTDVDPVTLVQRQGTGVRLTVDGLTDGVANTLQVAATDLEVARTAGATVPNNNRYEIADNTPPVEGDKLSIKVELEKVGLAGDGGELVIGSMNKQAGNNWDAVDTIVERTISGVEQFDVTVLGNNTKSSSLAGLHSTNNNLRVVNVTTDAAQTETFANLTIGNTNTVGGNAGALKDVQVLDASAFKGNLDVDAALTSEVTAKYLNLKDQAPAAPAADNVAFKYTGGTGNDKFNVEISAFNFMDTLVADALDTTVVANGAATREDFTFNIDGGAGDDEIVVSLADAGVLANAAAGTSNWYLNQQLLKNLSVNGGAGNDTIWTVGSGDFRINAGEGNDAVYADNTGAKSAWTLNYNLDAGQADIESGFNHSYLLFGTNAVVNFQGFEVKVAIADQNGRATDLDINQAIKAAVNDNAVLNKLLVATDGPANTLVITSLIDGSQVGELAVTLEAPAATAIMPGDVQKLMGWYSGVTGAPAATDAAGFAAYFAGVAAQFNNAATNTTYLQVLDSNGADSLHTSDNTITGGAGDDVLVLGTGLNSNDTVKFEGFDNGKDTIVNFDADGASSGRDNLDFTSYGAVQVVGAFTAGTAAAVGQKFLQITESLTNAGEYKVELFTKTADTTENPTGATSDGVVVTLDFGASQNFNANPASIAFLKAADAVAPVVPVLPTDPADPVDVVVADLQTVDASTGAFNFVLNYTAAGVKLATINGFGDDDTIEIVGAPAGSELQLASSSADSLDFVFGATDFSNVWGVTLGQLDAALVTDVVAAPDLAAQVGVLDTAWNEWLLGA